MLNLLPASEAIEKIRAGEISTTDYLDACLARIDDCEAEVKAWVHLDPQRAREHAASIDGKIRAKTPCGPLLGIPVGVKDIFNTADMPTQMGSPLFENYTPGNDARVVYQLRQSGATIPGKTVTAEFAVHAMNKTVNPHNPAHSPGTSSSGSAAAVSAGMVPFALGTQTAGSIIRPASYCGVYGFKPSFGLIPRTGMLKTTDSLDQVGYFARSVEDLALLFGVVRVKGMDYPLADVALNDASRQIVEGRPWRVGVVASSLWVWKEAYEYARTSFSEFAASIGASGAVVEEVMLPSRFNDAHQIHETIYDKTLAYYFKEEFEQHQLISPVLNQMIRHGQTLSLEQYKSAVAQQAALSGDLERLFGQYDIVVALSTAGSAPKWGDADVPDSSLVWSLCGVPVINIPAFRGPGGLPYGAQAFARRYNDPLLLNFLKHMKQCGLISDAPIANDPRTAIR